MRPVHDDLETNAAAHVVQTKGNYETARQQADLIVRRRFLYDRGASAAIENRAIVAQWDTRAEELTIWNTTQAPIPIRNGMAARLGLLESQVRVVERFVAGGFGPKIMLFYPAEPVVPWRDAPRRPRAWTEDRRRTSCHDPERGRSTVEMALARRPHPRRARPLSLRYRRLRSVRLTIPINTQCTLLGRMTRR